MKRPPLPGEPGLVHVTEQTGDVQRFAICSDNYDPAALAAIPQMTREPVMGYQLYVERYPHAVRFTVMRADGTALTRNDAWMDGGDIHLHTSVMHPMPREEAFMMADLEQCAAISLLGAMCE